MSLLSVHLSAVLSSVLASLSSASLFLSLQWRQVGCLAVTGVPVTSSANPLGREILFSNGSYHNGVSLDQLGSYVNLWTNHCGLGWNTLIGQALVMCSGMEYSDWLGLGHVPTSGAGDVVNLIWNIWTENGGVVILQKKNVHILTRRGGLSPGKEREKMRGLLRVCVINTLLHI